MQEYVLSVKVVNNNGVLLRVSSLFSRRCFSIKSLNAAETEVPDVKLYDVIDVTILDDAVCREHVLVRAGRSSDDRLRITEIANLYRAKPVDVSADSIMLELTGEPRKIDSFIDLLKPFGIIKMVRSGISALERD